MKISLHGNYSISGFVSIGNLVKIQDKTAKFKLCKDIFVAVVDINMKTVLFFLINRKFYVTSWIHELLSHSLDNTKNTSIMIL